MGVQELEAAIAKLPPEELAAFRRWFVEFDGDLWGKQLEADAKSGKLDRIAEQADRDFDAGRCTPL